MRLTSLIAFFALILQGLGSQAGPNWPQFRGPGSSGVSTGGNLPHTWNTTQNVVWRQKIPGRGWSSPIVWGNQLFLTSAINEGTAEDAKKGLYTGGNRHTASPFVHRWMVYCLDVNSGKVLWERQVHEGKPETAVHIKNTYASETPVTDGERVYAYFGSRGLFAYDMSGKELWSKELGRFKMRYDWGTASSPVLHEDRIYVVHDNEENSFLVALNKRTGKEVWREDRDEKSNWSTPFVWENPVRTEIVTAGTGKVRSYDLEGELLWELKGMSSITIPTPFAAHGLLYISSGFVLDPLRPVYAIRPESKGDISLKADEDSSASIVWCRRDAAPYNPSPIVYGDYFYTLFDRGFLGCFDARTGEIVFKKRRIAKGASAFTSSPWAYDGQIFCLSEDGDTYVIQAGADFKVLHVNSLEEMCMATPAIAGGKLFIRTFSHLYCIQKGGKLSK